MSNIGSFLGKIGQVIVANKVKSIVIGSVLAVAVAGVVIGTLPDEKPSPHVHTPRAAMVTNLRYASCTEDGRYDEVIYCSECREELDRKTITTDKATGHIDQDANYFCDSCNANLATLNLRYILSSDRTYYIVSGRGQCKDSDIVISPVYNGLPVKEIGTHAFYNCTGLTSVVIPDSVTSIGNSAFYGCDSLTSVVIPDSVTSIGDWAFKDCTNLTSVVIPDSVTSIGNSAFYGCSSLTSVVIPDSVTSIGGWAFFQCYNLTNVVIPDSVRSIGTYAFGECRGLVNIYYCGTVLQWVAISKGGQWDYDSSTIQGRLIYNLEYNCEPVGEYIFSTDGDVNYLCGYVGNDADLALPANYNGETYAIYSSAFAYTNLTSVVIPDSVTSIGEAAFKDCINLQNIYYRGTSEQWNAISKGYDWNYNTGFTIQYKYTGE